MEYTTETVKEMTLEEIRKNAKELRATSRRDLRPRANPKVMAVLEIADLEPSPERDHRWDPSAEDPSTIEMINEHHAKQVEMAYEAGIEFEEKV